ncbi:hypothetical protein [Kaistia sp. MMO-174]|uniref:hypothetical protein n=1 Tax=Kaistia sp. MMO-174 TaxID=3081256 RepID=UPI003015FA63
MSEWQPIESAPRKGKFFALNHDGEIWVARFGSGDQLNYRTNHLHTPRSFQYVQVGNEMLLREDEAYAEAEERWSSEWTIWSRLYEFKPTHWAPIPPLPAPPTAAKE